MQKNKKITDKNIIRRYQELWKFYREKLGSDKLRIVNNRLTIKKENKWSKSVTRMVLVFSQKYNINNKNKYINFSVNDNNVGVVFAVVTRMVLELPHKQFILLPGRSLGANPGSGAAPNNMSMNNEKNKKSAIDIIALKALLVMQNVSIDYEAQLEVVILTDVNSFSNNNYINFSLRDINPESAPEAQLEVRSSHKRGLDRHASSILAWGGSVPENSDILKINCEVIR